MTMSFDAVMAALEAAGSERTRATYLRHGATEPLFGVKFGDLRPLAKRIGTLDKLKRPFQEEMSRFLPGTIRASSVDHEDFWPYLTTTITDCAGALLRKKKKAPPFQM